MFSQIKILLITSKKRIIDIKLHIYNTKNYFKLDSKHNKKFKKTKKESIKS